MTNLPSKSKWKFLTIIAYLIISNHVFSQPSGGPYGPIKQVFEIPKTNGTIYYVAPNGNISSPGTQIDKPTTIEAAVKKAKTGDAIIVRGGTYRTGNLEFNQGFTLQAYKDETPVFKGTYVADKWEKYGWALWRTKWENLFPEKPADWWHRHINGVQTPLHRFNNDMVFIDGKFLQSAGWMGEIDENSYYIDYEEGYVYLNKNPKDKLVEITAFNIGLLRTTKTVNDMNPSHKGAIVKGITFTQYAYRAIEIEGFAPERIATESEYGNDVVGSVFEHCTFSFCSRVAGYFRGDSLVIRNCKIHDTSTEGLYIIASSDCILENNAITRNNIEMIFGYYPAAVKIFNQTHRVIFRNNYVADCPYSSGVWYDVGNVDGVFVNNFIKNIGSSDFPRKSNHIWPSENGFFFEISKGAICAGNVFVNCDHGIFILNSCDVKVYNNTFLNSTAVFGRNDRGSEPDHFGWHPTSGPSVDERDGHEFANNVLVKSKEYKQPLLLTWQPNIVCGRLKNSQFSKISNNLYVMDKTPLFDTLAFISPANNDACQIAVKTLDELQKYTNDSKNSKVLYNESDNVFNGTELDNYKIQTYYQKQITSLPIPKNISPYIEKGNYIGCYSFK